MIDRFDFIAYIPGLVIAKDYYSTYLNITQAFAKLLGWSSAEDCLGKTDYDIPCKAVEFADDFIKMDKQVITTNERMLTLDIQPYASGWKLILAERNPVHNEKGECVGLFNHCIDVSQVEPFHSYVQLHKFDNTLLKNECKPSSYILNRKHSPFKLTEKQENCLFLLLRGRSYKEIAKILAVSPRTIESHIDALKNKLNCYSRADIIEKAINQGYLYYIPETFQNQTIVKIIEDSRKK